MTTLDTSFSLSDPVQGDGNTKAAGDEQLADVAMLEMENRKKWNQIIDQLESWWKDPSKLIWDNDFAPPSRDIIELAFQSANRWRDNNNIAFDRVAPDGEGGITFEAYQGLQHVSLTINSDLTVEFLRFEDCRLVESYIV
ncbi:MAG: hypothetical protein JW849_00465 [Phycisphaerae bacterium]|nr:hypothetical protein [Phycisphaerae bacterium]